MEKRNKNIILVLTIVAIILVIFLIEYSKVGFTSLSENATTNLGLNSGQAISEAQKYPPAEEFVDPSGFINSAPFNLSQYIGKDVILIDFWDYSCINCERTIPYVEGWYKKYSGKGLIIIGIHTPEFDFEKNITNVETAVKRFGITYPVVLDNNYQTWQAYGNEYWPHEYLIDINGYIPYNHIGEGGYNETESEIQKLLLQRAQVLGIDNLSLPSGMVNVSMVQPNFNDIGTAEIYFGYGFSRGQNGNSDGWQPGQIVNYTATSAIIPGDFYLSGKWKNNNDNMELVGNNGSVYLEYTAKDVNIVSGSSPITPVVSYIDGSRVNLVYVGNQTLYHIVNGDSYGTHKLRLDVNKGFKIYTFTFG